MEHQLCRQPSHTRFGDNYSYSAGPGDVHRNVWSPVQAIHQNTFNETMNKSGDYISSVKRQREHHVIIDSSQDEDYDFGLDNQHDDYSMMDCDNDDTGPKKRRRLDYSFPLTNSDQLFQIEQLRAGMNSETNASVIIQDYVGRNLTSVEKENPPMEWWKKKRSLIPTAFSTDAAMNSERLVKQESSSPCSAMDTSGCDDEICCHICRKRFPLPSIPSVCQVMPANALLNYFTPLNKKGASNGDVAMSLGDSPCIQRNKQNLAISPACCSCCDRPSCPECRRDCDICQKSFCSFCSVDVEGSNCFCLDCNDRLR